VAAQAFTTSPGLISPGKIDFSFFFQCSKLFWQNKLSLKNEKYLMFQKEKISVYIFDSV